MEFDSYGNLTPYQVIETDLATVRQRFVDQFSSVVRVRLFDAFIQYINDVEAVTGSGFFVWINGSFITQKPEPNDIDFVIFIDYQHYQQHERTLEQIRQRRFLPGSGVDGYFVIVYPTEHRQRSWFESDQIRWLHDFGTSLSNRRKGIVQLNV